MRSLNKIKSFTSFLQVLRAKADYLSVKELLNEIIEETGYVADLQAEGTEEAAARIENIDELISKIADYEESAEQHLSVVFCRRLRWCLISTRWMRRAITCC